MVGVEEVWPLVEVLLLPLKVVGFVHVTIAFALHANHQSMIVFAGKDAAAVGKGLRGSLVKRQLKSIWRVLFG